VKVIVLGIACALFCLTVPAVGQQLSAGHRRARLPSVSGHGGWWISASAIHRVTLKPNTRFWRFEHLSLDPKKAELQLRRWKDEGISAIEIFAPAEGGNSYDGLDAINRYRLDPGIGTVDDFRRLVHQAHDLGLAVIVFDNLGYSSIYAPQFQKACDDVRAGRNTPEARMYLWSDRADAPPPAQGNSYFLIRPNFPNYDSSKSEFWQWDDRCQHFYWTKWPGKDVQGNAIRLPQYNWTDADWPAEAEKVVRFWMDTGIDGMIVDAVNWYVGYNWNKGNHHITGVIASYGNKFSQPEGAGAFHTDDPVGWITEGHWTNLQDYGLGIWWEKGNNPLKSSIVSHDPGRLESALRSYHDRVVAAGGSLYVAVPRMQNAQEQPFAEALLATLGDLVCYCDPTGGITSPAPGIARLLKIKSRYPAFYQDSGRRQIPTNDDHKFYAFLRTSADTSQRILAIFNFQPEGTNIEVDAGAINAAHFRDLFTRRSVSLANGKLAINVPPFGYKLLLVN
jgi:hypothetical protein